MRRALIVVMCLLTALIFSACAKKEAARKDIPQYSIEQFYKNKQVRGGAFSPDETRLLLTSNESGIYNLYEITLADGRQHAVTNSTKESFFAIDYVPRTGEILYSADKGGNEISHIYLLKKDGSAKDLTPGEKEKASFLGWALDKGAFFYISNKRNPKYFDLYRMDVASWRPALVYTNDKGYDINGVSWDQKYIALVENVTTSISRLYLFDVTKKSLKEVSDPNAPGSYSLSSFSKDNRSMYYITDVGREFQYLARYDLRSGARSTVYETNWDVMYCYASEHEKYRVIGINADGKNEIKVIDLSSGKEVPFPEVPDGDILGVAISPHETLMRLSVGTSRSPANLYSYAFAGGGLKKLTTTLNQEINPDHLVAARVVRFRSFDSLEIPAIFYTPLNATPEYKCPALVWVHGGPGGQSRVGYSSLIQFLVNHGYAILAVNNRGSSGYGKTFYKMDDRDQGNKDLMDCVYGKKYLQTLDDIDRDRIGILGGSYGGYMTMAAMTFHPDEFRVGVDLFGVTNWLRTLRSIPPYWESTRKALYAELGDPYSKDSVRLYDYSPLFHAKQIKNPVIVLQGVNDPRVLKVESDEIVAAMKSNNVPVEYVVFDDEGHGFVKKENEIRGYGSVLKFLDTYLKAR